MHRAFIDPKLLDQAQTGQDFDLDPESLKRFTRVLRLQDGEPVELFDGTGRILTGVLSQKVLTQVQISHIKPKGPRIILYQAMVSMDKLEQITQHATELGVSEIVLFKAERSQIDFKDKMASKLERLTRIAQDASRQCGRADVPLCAEASGGKPFKQPLFVCVPGASGVIASIAKQSSWMATSPTAPRRDAHLSILIGPEGGFSPTEIEHFKSQGAQEISLAPYVLRTETASLAALAQIQGAFL